MNQNVFTARVKGKETITKGRGSVEKVIYIVRHCEATGQSPHAKLTEEGERQTKELAQFFEGLKIDQVISSPFVRALKTAWPIAELKGLRVEQDSRLSERVLSSRDFEDWLVKLEDTFLDVHVKYEGGESSIEAMTRVHNVLDGLTDGSQTVLVTHGNLMALLLRCFDERFGFEEWQTLTNPDVFTLRIAGKDAKAERIWRS